ncbi:MAG TPA: hypothetical protein VN794_02390 [Methylomirabilota bacterium]|nr:hypothetical protein [Methylomirabilota bacterium]
MNGIHLSMVIGIGVGLASLGAEPLARRYADRGELIVGPFAAAPFPHPARAEGHKYKEEVFSAQDHYSDSTVAIFIPKGFRETGQIDFVVHFHGWRNHVENVLDHYKLIEQLVESGRNAVLIVPQGPRDAADSFGGKLEDPDGFKRFMEEAVKILREKSALKRKSFRVGRIVLSGHSGGYGVISSILDHGGLTGQVREVWLFDALYGRTDKFLAWINRGEGRLIDIYTENGGTKEETERLMATLKQQEKPFLAARESDHPDLRAQRLIFLYTDLPHDAVVEKRQAFRDYLKTSCLEAISQ